MKKGHTATRELRRYALTPAPHRKFTRAAHPAHKVKSPSHQQVKSQQQQHGMFKTLKHAMENLIKFIDTDK